LAGAVTVRAQNPVTFRVNLSVKIAEQSFAPDSDHVVVRGSFNNWGGAGSLDLQDPDGDGVYEGTADLPDSLLNTTVYYKFVAVEGGSDHWEGDPNRDFAPVAGGQTLAVVYFDRDSVVSVPVNGQLHFQVDLSVQTAIGHFDPSTDSVYVRGNKFGWGDPPQGVQLLEDPNHPGLYTGVYTVSGILTGDNVEYKFTLWQPNAASKTVWEDGANKLVSFDGTETDADGDGFIDRWVPVTFFNGLSFNDVLGQDTLVTFRVDMTNARRAGGGAAFDPSAENVWINGAFLNWWTWNSRPAADMMHDDGQDGDEVAGDLIYSWQYLFHAGDARRFEYKYGIESGDNEAGFAVNHFRYINADGEYVMPVDTFGVAYREPGPLLRFSRFVRSDDGHGGARLSLAWNGGPGITLQRTDSLTASDWKDVEGTTGLSSVELPIGAGNAFFRLVQ
jgi:hypothetical protein